MTARLQKEDKKSLLQTIRDFFAMPQWTREIIGKVSYVMGDFWKQQLRNSNHTSLDESIPDYAFWDKLRHGKARGFEISGLFAQPTVQIMTSWVLSTRILASLSNIKDRYTNEKLRKFLRINHGAFIEMVSDLYALGDQYAIVNPDGSITFPSPELVDVQYNLMDHRKIDKVTITTKRKEATITDVYTDRYRELSIQYTDGKHTSKRFENLIGKIPVVHFANDRANNETNGRPIYDALYRLLERYNVLIEKGLDGAELLGNPMPVFEEVDDVDEVIRHNADPDATEFDAEGNPVETINWGALSALFVQQGKFDFKSPRINFTADIREMLKVLFLLVLEFTRIPEAVWGGELTSSRSTAIEQMKTFYTYVKFRRLQLEGRGGDTNDGAEARGGMLELLDLWLRTKKLTDPQIVLDDVTLYWEQYTNIEPDVMLKSVQYASGNGWISAKSALKHLGLMDEDSLQFEELNINEDEQQALDRLQDDTNPDEIEYQAELLRRRQRLIR